MSEMKNIKLFRDGNRMIVVFENADADLSKLLLAFLETANGTAGAARSVPLEPLPPVPEEAPPMIPETGDMETPGTDPRKETEEPKLTPALCLEYAGMTPAGAIRKDGDLAVVRLFGLVKKMTGPIRESTVAMCKFYLRTELKKRLEDPETPRDEMESFFKLYHPMIQAGEKQITQQAGYSEFSDFLSLESDTVIRSAYRRVVEDLIGRGKE